MLKHNFTLLISIWLNLLIANASINELLEKFQIPDSSKIKFLSTQNIERKLDILNDAGFYYTSRNADLSIFISTTVYHLADSINYEFGKYDAQNNLGIAFYRHSRFKQAIVCFDKAYKIARKMKIAVKEASVLSNKALVFNSLSDYEQALKYNFEALKIRMEEKDSMGIAFSYNNIGMTYHYQTNYSQALDYYTKALKIKLGQNDKEGLATTYNNIGQLFFEMYSGSQKWTLDSALAYYLKAYFTFSAVSNKAGLSEVLPNIGNVYSLKNLYDKAFDAYLAAMNVQKQAKDSAGLALTLFNLGVLYYNQSDYNQSKTYFNKSIDIANKLQIADLIKDNLKMLFFISGNNHDYKTAFELASEYATVNDSLNDISRKQLVEDYSGKYEYQIFERKQLETSIKNMKTLFIFISSGLIVSVIILLIWVRRKKSNNLKGA